MLEGLGYDLVHDEVRVAGHTLSLTRLADFEQTAAQVYGGMRRSYSVREGQDRCPMFGVVWSAALTLARKVAADPDLPDLEVLELGCGLAVPSLVAARRGARVLATDQHPHTWPFLARNLADNGLSGRVRYASFHWLDALPPGVEGVYPRVMASDVLFAWDMPELVAATFDRFLAADGVGWLADPGRAWSDAFVPAVESRGLSVELEADDDAFLFVLRRTPAG